MFVNDITNGDASGPGAILAQDDVDVDLVMDVQRGTTVDASNVEIFQNDATSKLFVDDATGKVLKDSLGFKVLESISESNGSAQEDNNPGKI